MRRMISCVLLCVILFTACSADGGIASTEPSPQTAPSTAETTTEPIEQQPTDPTEPSTTDAAYDPMMTELANRLGITRENYPRMDGSTSTLRIVQELWYVLTFTELGSASIAFPETASKTVPSYYKLINGEVDLIFVPYASEEVLQAAADAGVELEFHKIAAEALIFITPMENTASNITREQVRSIYLDYGITNWSELGGPDRALIPLCRNADSGSQSQMDNLVLENEPMHPDIQNNYVELTMEGMLELTAFYHYGGIGGEPTNSYALGYTLYSYLQNSIEVYEAGANLKILAYDGVIATEESIADGSYPLSDGYYAVTRADLPEDHSAYAIISWLQSPEGVEMIERIGLISCVAE